MGPMIRLMTLAGVAWLLVTWSFAAERSVVPPRVPSDELKEVRTMTNPLPVSPENVETGKALYGGKGTCVNCHGRNGEGDGPVAGAIDPSPRNFRNPEFWRHRSDGELFWVIKRGSAGTSMIGFVDQLSDAEIWTLVHYLRTFE